MSSSTDDSSSSSSESSSGETKQISCTSSRPERSSKIRLQRKSRSRHVPDLGEPSNVLQKSDGKIDRGLPGHFPGQDRRDQGHQQERGKEENLPETRGISACVIVQDQIHGIDLQDGTFVKLTRTPQLAVLKNLIKRLLRKPTQIQDRCLQRQPTSRKVSWFMLSKLRAVRLFS